MDNLKTTLASNLKALRNAYQLPIFEAEWVCGVSRSAINTWERGTRIPSADGLFQIATSFCVSLDWLYGVTDTPYTEASVLAGEKIHKPSELIETVLQHIRFLPKSQYEQLANNYITNIDAYSLEARANILVFILYLKGYYQYFGSHDGTVKLPLAQQSARRDSAQRGLITVLTTGFPATNPF